MDCLENAGRLSARGVHLIQLDDESRYRLMQDFIGDKPGLWNEDIGL